MSSAGNDHANRKQITKQADEPRPPALILSPSCLEAPSPSQCIERVPHAYDTSTREGSSSFERVVGNFEIAGPLFHPTPKRQSGDQSRTS